jgi:methyl-accepting chemotaxis protein
MDQLTKNNLDIEVPYQTSKSQLGSMARRVQIFKENALEKRALEQRQAVEKEHMEAEKKQMLEDLAGDFEAQVGKVIEALKNATATLKGTAKTLGIIVDNTNTKVGVVASATAKAASNVGTVASATEQLISAIEEVNHLVTKSAHIATSAVEEMAQANHQVEKLSGAMAQIGDVSKLIQDIAEQTNLLALNATIEAARAGDAGKGFAVVASEVKNLASQTAQATERISNHISTLRGEANDVANVIKNATETVAKLNEITSSIASCVEQERSATIEISRSVQEASSQTSEVSSSIDGVAHAASETDKSAKALMESVTDLSSFSQELDTRVEAFLNTVKKAA